MEKLSLDILRGKPIFAKNQSIMNATAALEKTKSPASTNQKNGKPAHISTEKYYAVYADREDGWKYELVDGRIVKFKKTMNDSQFSISTILHDLFYSLKMSGKVKGTFQAEKDTELWKDHVRRPDMCYATDAQVLQAKQGGHPVAEFVIEVISPTDLARKYTDKVKDYFKAGVKVVWLIYPNTSEVYVYVKGSRNIAICEGDTICSAAPVLPEFAIPANEIFR